MTSTEPEGNSESSKRAASRLPPELRFITEVPDLKAMDVEEKLEFPRERLKKMHQHRDAFVALGWNPDDRIAHLEKLQGEIEAKTKEVDAAEDTLLHATADLADAERELFQACSAAVEQAHEQQPFDPQVQEWKEELEEWRKHMPKEDGP